MHGCYHSPDGPSLAYIHLCQTKHISVYLGACLSQCGSWRAMFRQAELTRPRCYDWHASSRPNDRCTCHKVPPLFHRFHHQASLSSARGCQSVRADAGPPATLSVSLVTQQTCRCVQNKWIRKAGEVARGAGKCGEWHVCRRPAVEGKLCLRDDTLPFTRLPDFCFPFLSSFFPLRIKFAWQYIRFSLISQEFSQCPMKYYCCYFSYLLREFLIIIKCETTINSEPSHDPVRSNKVRYRSLFCTICNHIQRSEK